MNRQRLACYGTALIASLLVFGPMPATACSAPRDWTPDSLLLESDGVYRAIAIDYLMPQPSVLSRWRESNPQISFQIVETLKGNAETQLFITGVLAEKDDLNDRPVPYDFVRPAGRRGSCQAEEYRRGAEYLLIIKDGSPYWSVMAPTNEQLLGPSDPWLAWVKRELESQATQPNQALQPTGAASGGPGG